jgi:hypothetical protein
MGPSKGTKMTPSTGRTPGKVSSALKLAKCSGKHSRSNKIKQCIDNEDRLLEASTERVPPDEIYKKKWHAKPNTKSQSCTKKPPRGRSTAPKTKPQQEKDLLEDYMTMSFPKDKNTTKKKRRVQPERVARHLKTPNFNLFYDSTDSESSVDQAAKKAKARWGKRKATLPAPNHSNEVIDLTFSDRDDGDIKPIQLFPKEQSKKASTRRSNAPCRKEQRLCADKTTSTRKAELKSTIKGHGIPPARRDTLKADSSLSSLHSSSSSDSDSVEAHHPIDHRYLDTIKKRIAIVFTPRYLTDPHNPKNDPNFFGYLPPQTLAVGDVIEFSAPEGTAGIDYWMRRSTIVGFKIGKTRGDYPLVLDPINMLPRSHLVRRLSSANSSSKGSDMRRIKDFVFVGHGGEQSYATSFAELGQKGKKMQLAIQKKSDEWWRMDRT